MVDGLRAATIRRPVVVTRSPALRRLPLGVMAILLAGCSLLPPPAGIQVTLPAAPEVAALPVTVVDTAAIVRHAGPADDGPSDLSSTSIDGIPGRDDAIRVAWLGGQCADRATVTVSALDGRYRVTVEEHSSATACSLAGVRRSILLELIAPIGADAFGTY